ncbi:MAG: MobC family plasmid mobilization relaxosome protein [Ruminococcus sp.]|nr:MobC family plasmid mobilization relaxosome protein [Ruminococcus sp.]
MTFRVSADEYEVIMKKIAESGLNNQEYILRAVLHTTIQSNTELKELLPELKKVSTELNRQGNNLNQIATVLNQQGYVDYKNTLPQTLEAVQNAIEGVKEVWQLLRQYLQSRR